MFSTTDCDLRYAAHTERVAGIDRTGWQTTAAAARPRLAWVGALTARVGRQRPSVNAPLIISKRDVCATRIRVAFSDPITALIAKRLGPFFDA